jgi:cytoskeletal protein CcmA (bactofilin family)
MFKRNTTPTETQQPVQAVERITSVLGSGVIWHGSINGSGGVRIEGAFEGEIALRGTCLSSVKQGVSPAKTYAPTR